MKHQQDGKDNLRKTIGKCSIYAKHDGGYLVMDNTDQHITLIHFSAMWEAERYCTGRDRRTPYLILGNWKIDYAIRNHPITTEPRWHYTISRAFYKMNGISYPPNYHPMATDQLMTFVTSFGFQNYCHALNASIRHLNRLRGSMQGYDRQEITS